MELQLCTRCHKDYADPGRHQCPACLAYARLKYQAKQAKCKTNQLCRRCGKRPPVEGYVHCQECIDYTNSKSRTYYRKNAERIQSNEDRKAKARAREKARREQAIAKGLCDRCMKYPAAPGFKSCQACLDKRHQRYKEKKERLTWTPPRKNP